MFLERFGAGLAQLVAQLICNHQVGGSNPSAGTIEIFKELDFQVKLFKFKK